MKWTANHSDGFTERLLHYQIRCDSGRAELAAGWFWPRPGCRDFRTSFTLDDEPIVRILPALRSLDERYDAPWEDQGSQGWIIELDGEVIRRNIYGGGVLIGERPELRPFLDLFDWLENQVLAQLPLGP